MQTLKNNTGSKIVNITERQGTFTCMYCDVYQGEQQVLDSKSYASKSAAIKWANKQLSA
jgi:hypothetical protein